MNNEFKVTKIGNEDEKRVIYVSFTGDAENINANKLIDNVAIQIYNSPKILKEFFANDINDNYIKILEQVGECEKDNEYIDLKDYEYIDTSDFIPEDIDNLILLIHKPFIILCLQECLEDIDNCIDKDNNIITLF